MASTFSRWRICSRHGPHHVAQRSTKMGLPRRVESMDCQESVFNESSNTITCPKDWAIKEGKKEKQAIARERMTRLIFHIVILIVSHVSHTEIIIIHTSVIVIIRAAAVIGDIVSHMIQVGKFL